MTPDTPRLRLGILGIISVSLFCALFARTWYLQVMAAPEYAVAAEANQQRMIVEPAPRGRILDRNGIVLVDNRLSIVVTIDRQLFADLDEDEQSRVLTRLAEELTHYGKVTSSEEILAKLANMRYGPYSPVPIVEDVPEALAVYVSERRPEFTDAVDVEPRAVRHYPFGRLGSHVLGYVGPINEDEYAAHDEDPKEYQLDDEIGKAGVEATFEQFLRGVPGRRVVEVDSRGNVIRELDYTPPVAGSDIVLTLDANLQALAEAALADQLARARAGGAGRNPPTYAPAGSTVVLDPRNGELMAMASYPNYDASAFTDGISDPEWAALNDPAHHYPLINRAIEGQYAPGSTFKLLTAYSAMSTGAINETTSIYDPGSYTLDNCEGRCTFYNAGRAANGMVDIRRALTVSSDVFFYQLGANYWFQRDVYGDPIQDAARDFGLGADSGIDLPNEKSGLVPTPELKAERHEDNPEAFPEGRWRAGDNINISVGQGDMLVTPLQLANAYGTLANGGTVWRPMVVRQILAPGAAEVSDTIEPHANGEVGLPPIVRQPIVDGLAGATRRGDGTARSAFRGFTEGFNVAGKTGTAQVSGGRADTSVFVGFGPVENPQYVVAAILEESGFGGEQAAPLVRRMFDVLADPGRLPRLEAGVPVVLPEAVAAADAVD
ncbi:MAG: penicillin-binding protein 2 [Acidimicrobiales bacterium]